MADTIIGSSIVVDGEISGVGEIVVRGTVKGKIQVNASLVVESSGVVEADVETASTTISGQLTGNVIANDRVELTSQGRMSGSIKSPRILIAEGASFKGSVDMEV